MCCSGFITSLTAYPGMSENGGQVVETVEANENYQKTSKTLKYDAVGMQTLIDAIREQGANNLIIVGGWTGASICPTPPMKSTGLWIPGGQWHDPRHPSIPWKSKNWSFYIDKAGEHYPIIVGEFGVGPDKKIPANPMKATSKLPRNAFNWIEKNNYSFAAWSFHPSAGPCIIRDGVTSPLRFTEYSSGTLLIKTASRGVESLEGVNYTGRSTDIKPGDILRLT